jgi:hypothetical protein
MGEKKLEAFGSSSFPPSYAIMQAMKAVMLDIEPGIVDPLRRTAIPSLE